MTQVDAIFQNGVFQPLQTVQLPDQQRVRLSVQSLANRDVAGWLARVRQLQQRIIAHCGCLPDSAPDIAEDRRR